AGRGLVGGGRQLQLGAIRKPPRRVQIKGSPEINPAVSQLVDLGLYAKVKVLKVPSFAEEVTLRATATQDSIVYPPVARLFRMRLPPGQIRAVEQLNPVPWLFPRIVCLCCQDVDLCLPTGSDIDAKELHVQLSQETILAERIPLVPSMNRYHADFLIVREDHARLIRSGRQLHLFRSRSVQLNQGGDFFGDFVVARDSPKLDADRRVVGVETCETGSPRLANERPAEPSCDHHTHEQRGQNRHSRANATRPFSPMWRGWNCGYHH